MLQNKLCLFEKDAFYIETRALSDCFEDGTLKGWLITKENTKGVKDIVNFLFIIYILSSSLPLLQSFQQVQANPRPSFETTAQCTTTTTITTTTDVPSATTASKAQLLVILTTVSTAWAVSTNESVVCRPLTCPTAGSIAATRYTREKEAVEPSEVRQSTTPMTI